MVALKYCILADLNPAGLYFKQISELQDNPGKHTHIIIEKTNNEMTGIRLFLNFSEISSSFISTGSGGFSFK